MAEQIGESTDTPCDSLLERCNGDQPEGVTAVTDVAAHGATVAHKLSGQCGQDCSGALLIIAPATNCCCVTLSACSR